jgi:hypothetical protein
MGADLKQIALVPTAPEMKDTNLHNTKIWYAPDGTPFLSFPANDAGRVFTTSLAGELLNTLARPTDERRVRPALGARLLRGRRRVRPHRRRVPRRAALHHHRIFEPRHRPHRARDELSSAESGVVRPRLRRSGTGPGQLGTGHGITDPAGNERIDVADRANGEIDRFTRHGQYLSTLRMPMGSLPCDIDYLGRYAVVAALDGPDKSKGAPIYLLEDDRLVSTIFPKDDLGLVNFKHVHNAVLREAGGKLYDHRPGLEPGRLRGARAGSAVAS